MDLSQNHPEGHPNGPIIGDEWLRITEGFLEPDRLSNIITQNLTLYHNFSKKSEVTSACGDINASLLNQIIASIHLTAYHNAVLQIGVVKRLDNLCDVFDKIFSDEDMEYEGPPELPEEPKGVDNISPKVPEEPNDIKNDINPEDFEAPEDPELDNLEGEDE